MLVGGVCKKRHKGLVLQSAFRRKIKHFTGLTDPYENCRHPELIVDTENTSEAQCTEQIIAYLTKHGYIGRQIHMPRLNSERKQP